MVKVSRLANLSALAALSVSALACLNDRDTLAMESMGRSRMDVLKIMVGWFPVHPNLYYKLRIEQGLKTLQSKPADLEVYDDVAVAYERIGDDVSAIRTEEQKRKVLEINHVEQVKNPLTIHDVVSEDQIVSSSKDPWYRYYANTGTFWVHRWFHEGMPSAHKKGWLDRAQGDIDKAIELNPLAHGLREYAQDEMIRWIRTGKPGQTFSDFAGSEFFEGEKTAEALAGLIELGGAWESPDVYEALQVALGHRREMAYVAGLRMSELQTQGKRSLTGKTLTQIKSDGFSTQDESARKDYAQLRSAAEEYRRGLAAYEMPLLVAGRHPDTNPTFWSGYKEPEFPVFGRRTGLMIFLAQSMFLPVFCGAILLAIVIYIFGVVKRHLRLVAGRS
jgi:hypothetical protein